MSFTTAIDEREAVILYGVSTAVLYEAAWLCFCAEYLLLFVKYEAAAVKLWALCFHVLFSFYGQVHEP